MPVLTITITERECANCGRVDVDPALAGITGNRYRLTVFDCPECDEQRAIGRIQQEREARIADANELIWGLTV